MQDVSASDVVVAAVAVPVISLVAVWIARRIGRWILNALTRSFGEKVVEVMAPDMARLGTRLGSSIDEMRETNSADHTEVQRRLGDVETRLAVVESKLELFGAHVKERT